MDTITKRLLCLISLICSMFLLIGCADKSPAVLDSDTQSNEQPVDISDTAVIDQTAEELLVAPVPEDQINDELSSYDYSVIDINPDKVVITDVLPEDFPKTESEEYRRSPSQPDKSYAVVKVLSYPGISLGYQYDLEWVNAAYLPKFDDLDYPGADDIRNYYADMYKQEKAVVENYAFDDEVADSATQRFLYSFLDWDSSIVGNYLSVLWFSDWYGGGAHGLHSYYTEHFDLRTGKMLTNEDVFGDTKKAAPVLNPVITRHLETEHGWQLGGVAPLDISSDSTPLIFRLEQDGVTFIFNEYTIGSYADGVYFVFVPYDELREVLQINIEY